MLLHCPVTVSSAVEGEIREREESQGEESR